MDPGAERNQVSRRQRFVWLPLCFFVALAFIFDLVAFWVIDAVFARRGPPSVLVVFVFAGCLLGQVSIAIILGGLWSRSWLYGYALGSFLACTGVACLVLSINSRHYQFEFMPQPELFWAITVAPLLVLIASLPLYAARFFRGWILESGATSRPRVSSQVEDLFIVTAVGAAAMVSARLAQIMWEVTPFQFWLPIGVSASALAIISLFVLTPSIWISFRPVSAGRRIVEQSIFAMLVLAVSPLVSIPFNWSVQPSASDFEAGICGATLVLSALFVLFCGIWALLLCHVGLTHFRPRATDESTAMRNQDQNREAADSDLAAMPAEDIEPTNSTKNINRRLAIAFFCISLLATTVVGRIQKAWDTTDRRVATIDEELASSGGYVRATNRVIVDLETGREANDASIDRYLEIASLESLSLANSKITDSALDKLAQLERLRSLDLSGTDITSAAVPKLLKLSGLFELKLAATRLTAADVKQLIDGLNLSSLDVSDMNLTREELRNVLRDYRGSIALRNYGFDDTTLDGILDLQSWYDLRIPANANSLAYIDEVSLDFRGNAISGSCLAGLNFSINELRLEGNPLTETAFSPVASSLVQTRLLSLSDTLLTDKFLKALVKNIGGRGIIGLRLGDGRITEAGLPTLGSSGLFRLALNSRQFSGKCFRNWTPDLFELDMSGSAIDDETVAHLINLPNLRYFHVRNTSLTDIALRDLAKLRAIYLDLSGTRVTAEGLAAGDLQGLASIGFEVGQFSNEALRRIRQALPGTEILIGGQRREFGVD